MAGCIGMSVAVLLICLGQWCLCAYGTKTAQRSCSTSVILYNDDDVVTVSCAFPTKVLMYICHENKTFEIDKTKTVNGINFTVSAYVTKGQASFGSGVVGIHSCENKQKICNNVILLGRHMTASSYERHVDNETFVCENLYPTIVELWMYVNGSNVTGECWRHDNGSISYTASYIVNAQCVAHIPCINRSVAEVIYKLHDEYEIVQYGDDLRCLKNGTENASILSTDGETGVKFSDRGDYGTTTIPWNTLNETSYVWCVRFSDNGAYISDPLRLNKTFWSARISESSSVRRLACSTIVLVNIIYCLGYLVF
ncbi:b149.11 [miniopterid betaherpesvirus 1]|uniref:B149.11 n=1 Tax=miniopterid betaherpesvirus 1 TaxID=3070189 RepID=I3VQE4_9BETA|nr:b149.11 [miniopterid betaherpesvirus 1]AFK83988.1 b149.11 [miniopterid betaherpesvirus 1]